jgi:hypothetical protein
MAKYGISLVFQIILRIFPTNIFRGHHLGSIYIFDFFKIYVNSSTQYSGSTGNVRGRQGRPIMVNLVFQYVEIKFAL